MTDFTVHTKDTAPASSTDLLKGAEQNMGFVPNLLGVMAEAPATLKGYMTITRIFDETSFTATERQVVLLAINRYHDCRYCMAAHSVIAGMQNVPADVIRALREDTPISDVRLEALRQFARAVVDKRGWVTEEDVADFSAAGYGKQQVLEVILGAAMKVMSNYTNHVAATPVDAAFSPQTWAPADTRQAS